MAKRKNDSWNGVEELKKHLYLTEQQAIAIHADISAYIALRELTPDEVPLVIYKIISEHAEHIEQGEATMQICDLLANKYLQNSKDWTIGETLWAPTLYIISFISLLIDSIVFLEWLVEPYTTITMLAITILLAFVWVLIDRKSRKQEKSDTKKDTSESNRNKLSLLERTKLFSYVTARYVSSITLVLYMLYYFIKFAAFMSGSTTASIMMLGMFSIVSLIIIPICIYNRYRTYRNIKEKYNV